MATTRKIIVEIEAGEKNCHNCHLVDGYGFCLLLRTPIELDEVPNRLPACLASEAKLKRLIEAAGGITNWFNGRSPGFRERCSIEKFNELAAALKEVKGE